VLRPEEFTRGDIEDLKLEPEWALLYQQGLDKNADARLKRSDFLVVGRDEQVAGPCAISVDIGVGENTRNSYSCFQVWTPLGRQRYQLNDQRRERLSFEEQKAILRGFYHRCRPSVILIESTATGPALVEYARNHFHCEIVPIFPRGSKLERLRSVLHVFKRGEVTLFRDGPYVEDFLQEATNFPKGDYDDIMDAMTQMFSWGEQLGNLPLKPMPKGGLVAVGDSNGRPLQANGANVIQGPHTTVALGSRQRPWWRDHFR
jgi:predicted phage terminase large subunit-like protein